MTGRYQIVREQTDAEETSLVFLHGFLGRPAMWEPVIADLGTDVPVAYGTLPGHGLFPWTSAVPEFSAAVDGLIDALPFCGPVWLVGYSMGARVALGTYVRHPERVAGIVLISVDPGLVDASDRAERARRDEIQASRVQIVGVSQFVHEWEELPLFATEARLPGAVRMGHRAERNEHTAAGLAWAIRVLGLGSMPSLWPALGGCTRPVCIVTGALDEKFTALGEKIVRETPLGTHCVVPGVGHNVALEAPGLLAGHVRRAVTADWSFLEKT